GLDQMEHELLSRQLEQPGRHPKGLALAAAIDRDERIAAARDRLAHFDRPLAEQPLEALALEALSALKERPRGGVSVADGSVLVAQHGCQRSRLEHGLQQQLVLLDVVVLSAQHFAERVEAARHLAGLVAPFHSQPDGVVLLAQAEQAVRYSEDDLPYRAG